MDVCGEWEDSQERPRQLEGERFAEAEEEEGKKRKLMKPTAECRSKGGAAGGSGSQSLLKYFGDDAPGLKM